MEFLSQQGVPYDSRDISENEEWLNELIATGYMATPVTIVGGTTVVGYDPAKLSAAPASSGLGPTS